MSRFRPALAVWLAVIVFGCGCRRDRQETALERLQRRGYGLIIDDYIRAAKGGDEGAVRDFLEVGMAVDVEDEAGHTAFQQAAEMGHARVVMILLGHGANPNQRLREGRTALIQAAAATPANLRYLEELLDHGANVKLVDGQGLSALMMAALHGDLGVVRMLIPHDVASYDKALMLAAAGGHTACIQWLLDHGAYVNCRSRDEKTPLMYAASKGHREAAMLLVQRGANAFALDGEGLTAADQAEQLGYPQLATDLRTIPAFSNVSEGMEGERGDQLESLHGQVIDLAPGNASPDPGADAEVASGVPASTSPRIAEALHLGIFHERYLPILMEGVDEEGAAATVRLLTRPLEKARVKVKVGDRLPGTNLAAVKIERKMVPRKDEAEAVDASVLVTEHVETGEPFEFLRGELTRDPSTHMIVRSSGDHRVFAAYVGDEFNLSEGNRRYRVLEVRPHQLILLDLETDRVATLSRREKGS